MLCFEASSNGPHEKEQTRPDFQYGARPILDGAVRGHTEDHERADSYAEEFHCLMFSADSGTKATSSIQAEPKILLSNSALGRRLAQS